MKTAYSLVAIPSILLFSSLVSAELLYNEDFSQVSSALDVWTRPWSSGPNSVRVSDGAMLVTGSRVDLISGDSSVADLSNTSVRARVSLDGSSSGGLGLMTHADPDTLVAYQAGIDPDDSEFYLGWNDPDRFNAFAIAPTDFDLFGGDEFNMQFDVFARNEGGYDMKFWAWPAGSSMPEFPQLTHVDTSIVLDPGEPAFLFDNLAAPGQSTALIHEFQVSNQSIMDSTKFVAPPGLENVFGNESGLPGNEPFRLQYVYDGAYFSDLESPISISGIAWRPNEGSPRTEAADDDVLIRLSTTAASNLDSRFAANTGDNEQQVFRGPLSINSAPSPSPSDFDLAADFDAPFVFDPTQGNLLVDVTFSGFDNSWTVDNEEFNDGITRLIVGDVDSEIARNNWPIVTPMQFTLQTLNDLDCNIDGIINIADANCASSNDLAELLDEAGLLLGDLDGNGAVEFEDFLTLSPNFADAGNYTDGDLNLNGTVDFADFLLLSSNFGERTAVSAVPEPTGSIGWIAVGFALVLRNQRSGGQPSRLR